MSTSVQTEPLFVSPQWLATRLDHSDIMIFDASWHMPAASRDASAEFLSAHIPGAVFFDIDAIADHETTLPHMLPSARVFEQAMRDFGLDNAMHAVIYDSLGLFSAPRLWWTLKVFGLDKVSILTGGLPAWRAAGYPLATGPATPRPASSFCASMRPALVANASSVSAALACGEPQVIDARASERFKGVAAEPRPGLRSGHMPGAFNLPFQILIDKDRFKSKAEIEAAFLGAGLDLDRAVIASCGSGLTACILSLALAAVGRAPAQVYDGSWAEWGQDLERAVVTD